MKLFVTVKEMLTSIDIIREKGRFHAKRNLRTLEGFLAIIMQCLYLLFDAETDREYMDSIFMTTVGQFFLNFKITFINLLKSFW